MTTQLDASIGIGKETTYGTAVVTDRFFEFLDEKFEWKPTFVQGQGLRVGTRVARNDRRKLGKQEAEGEISIEAVSKGMGRLFEAALGSSVSTQIAAGPGYQQNHTLATTDPLPSYTIQKGTPTIGGGATQALTFSGAVCKSLEISCSTGDIVQIKTAWTARDVVSNIGYAAPSYPTTPELFTFVDGAITIGGTVTMPTATALATGGTTVATITDFDLTIDNKLDDGGFTIGGGGKKTRRPVVSLADVKGKLTAEYQDNVLRDAYLNQTGLAVVLTFQSSIAITAGVFPTLQIVLPMVKLEGDLPNASAGKPIMQSIDYTVLDPSVSGQAPLYVIYRTADTTI
jgi:hypothetical protein